MFVTNWFIDSQCNNFCTSVMHGNIANRAGVIMGMATPKVCLYNVIPFSKVPMFVNTIPWLVLLINVLLPMRLMLCSLVLATGIVGDDV